MHGWLILDKPYGLGSTQAVSAVKRALRRVGAPKARVGHGGTLDPLATGVLPIALGEATKLAGRMLDADKGYDFTIRFGQETDTLDAEGAVVAESAARPTRGQVEAVLVRFTGPICQTPPAYSALKVDGRRAYDLARAGEAVALAERDITIYDLGLGECRSPRNVDGLPEIDQTSFQTITGSLAARRRAAEVGRHDKVEAATISARVSKGTYIRSLARDIARALGTVGHVTMLRRTKAGPFALPQAITLDKLDAAATAADVQALLLPLTAGLDDIPVLAVTPEQAVALRQGKRLSGAAVPHGLTLAMLGDVPIALVDVADEISVVRGLNLMSE